MRDEPDNPNVDVWNLVGRCKSRAGYRRLYLHVKVRYDQLKTVAHSADSRPRFHARAETILSEYGAAMYALGFVRGMQLGRELDSKTEGGTVGPILKHAPIRRLLLSQPKASTLEVCRELDKVEGMPWPELRKRYGGWEAASKQPLVKMAITNARKAAVQAAKFDEFLTVAKAVGDEGSILNQFRQKKYGLRVNSK